MCETLNCATVDGLAFLDQAQEKLMYVQDTNTCSELSGAGMVGGS